ncbi:MAG TPA: hypothetical protein VNB68_00935, partial [Nitrososphaeraceae archaeon]|nr:hypothetical protein [Nitrososphaeraceae archaeon]
LSCINFAIFGYNHRVLQTFLSTITKPNQCNYGAGVSSRKSKLPFQSQNKLKSKNPTDSRIGIRILLFHLGVHTSYGNLFY